MTQSAAPIIGQGSQLSIGTQGGSPTFTAIVGIRSVKAPAGKWGTEDITTLTTSGFSRRFIKTLEEAGEADVSLIWESADPGQVAILAAYAQGSNIALGGDFPFKLVLPINLPGGQTTTADTLTFNALVTDFTRPEVQVDKTITWSFKLKVDGAVTITEGS